MEHCFSQTPLLGLSRADRDVGRSLQRQAGVPVANHHVLLDVRLGALGAPDEEAGPAVAVDDVVADVGVCILVSFYIECILSPYVAVRVC